MLTELEIQAEADAVIAGMAGGAMAHCPKCDTKMLSVHIERDDHEHPDERYKCVACDHVWEVFMPENIVRNMGDSIRGLIPFRPNGNQERWGWGMATRLRPRFVFDDTLTFQDTEKHRSTYCFLFKRKSTGTMVCALHTDIRQLIPLMVHGAITGRFTFRKRGSSAGVTLFKEKKPRAPRKTKTPKPKP